MQPPSLRRISQVAITVDDIESAVSFYRDTLGLTFLFRAGPMAFFDCGGTRLLVSTENTTDTKTLLYFDVADIHAAWKDFAAKGVATEDVPHVIARMEDRDVWLATFRDPSGTLHHLVSEVARD